MEHPAPPEIQSIAIVAIEVIHSEFREVSKPHEEQAGFFRYNMQCEPEFESGKQQKLPTGMILNVEANLIGFEGSLEKKSQATEIFKARIKFRMLFKVKKPEFTSEQILQYMWHFQALASLLSRQYMETLLGEGNYLLPIPFNAKPPSKSPPPASTA
jgi:hypothetical protein